MARILVTGGAGFIGSHFVRQLLEAGHEVTVLDSFSSYIALPIGALYVYNLNYRFEHFLNGARIIRGDTTNKDEVRRQLLAERPDRIVHFAALPLANMAIEYSEEAFNTIVGGTVNLLEVLRDVDFVSRFVYVSSSMVYGDFETVPIPEDARAEPKDIYGGMKLSGEYMVKVYSQRYGVPYSIVRPSAVYGPTDNNQRVVGLFLTKAARGEKIRVKNPDTTRLDFSFVGDTAQGLRLVALDDKAEGETFNITRGRDRSLRELVESVRDLYPDLEVEEVRGDTFRPNRGALDITKARDLLGYEPKTDLEEGLKVYADFLRQAMAATEGA